jgi:acetyltransferase-like isoleucine patch superfamily enzyme
MNKNLSIYPKINSLYPWLEFQNFKTILIGQSKQQRLQVPSKNDQMHFFPKNGLRRKQFLKWLANIITPLKHDPKAWERKNKILRLSGIQVGNGTAIGDGFYCLPGEEENLSIGKNVALGNNLRIYNFAHVSIGDFSMFAADATLVNGGHHRDSLQPFAGPLRIGRGCWIGNGARIVGALTIGDNAIIGAGAVVIHDVPPGAIVVGIPSKIVGHRNLPEKVWHLGDTFFDPRTFSLVQ